MTREILQLNNIVKKFGQHPQEVIALDDVSLKIYSGEIVSLVGPSGSGKTTLLQITGLLDSANSGSIFINNIDASKANDDSRTNIRRDNIGFIYQFHHLLMEFSALENVAMPLLVRGEKKSHAIEEARKILQVVGLENRINHKPSELSGGQQQRVAIARAIVGKPSLILADEPTGNLDPDVADGIFKLFQEINKQGTAILMATHNHELLRKYPYRVLKCEKGRLLDSQVHDVSFSS